MECDLRMRTKRNGEIDLLRFLCAVGIVVHHYNEVFPAELMAHGYTFVKFFFMLSGYFMVHSVRKLGSGQRSTGEIANATWSFIFRKIKSFYIYYIVAMVIQTLLYYVVFDYIGIKAILRTLLEAVPNLTLTFYGLNQYTALYVGGSWYLSVMILALFILFPIALRYQDAAIKLFFPLLAVFSLGYLNATYGSVSLQTEWAGICSTGTLHGIAQISLGASLYPLVEYLNANPQWQAMLKSRGIRLSLTLVKLVCYLAVLSYAQDASLADIHVLLLLAVGLTLSFSGSGFTIPENRLTRYLGRISLPIYLFHSLFYYAFYTVLMPFSVTPVRLLILSAAGIVLSVGLMHLVDFCTRRISAAFQRAFPKQ